MAKGSNKNTHTWLSHHNPARSRNASATTSAAIDDTVVLYGNDIRPSVFYSSTATPSRQGRHPAGCRPLCWLTRTHSPARFSGSFTGSRKTRTCIPGCRDNTKIRREKSSGGRALSGACDSVVSWWGDTRRRKISVRPLL